MDGDPLVNATTRVVDTYCPPPVRSAADASRGPRGAGEAAPRRATTSTIADAARRPGARRACAHCGVCHSDLSIVDGVFPAPTPIVLGHEAAGVVDAVGPDVDGARRRRSRRADARAAVRRLLLVRARRAGRVRQRRPRSQTNTFADGSTGLSRGGAVVFRGVGLGAFGEYVLMPATGAVKIPRRRAARRRLRDRLRGADRRRRGAQHGARRGGRDGAGDGSRRHRPLASCRARASPARRASSPPIRCRRGARRRAASARPTCVDPTTEDVVARTHELTGVGVDYAFDAVGRASLVQDGLARDAQRRHDGLRRRGADRRRDHDRARGAVHAHARRSSSAARSAAGTRVREIPRLIALWQAGRLDLEALITARRPLAEINDGVRRHEGRTGHPTILTV